MLSLGRVCRGGCYVPRDFSHMRDFGSEEFGGERCTVRLCYR